MKSSFMRVIVMLAISLVVFFGSGISTGHTNSDFADTHASMTIQVPPEILNTCAAGLENPILVPDTLYLADFETELYDFIMHRRYATDLNWCMDKRVRDTGPWIQNTYYGTHPAVRIYYSPRMMYWLTGNPEFWKEGMKSGEAKKKQPREGEVPSGAMIVKEMFLSPAAIYQQIEEIAAQSAPCEVSDSIQNLISSLITAWTVMIKTDEKNGAPDGWFWSNPGAPSKGQSIADAIAKQVANNPFESGLGLPCIRCHASAEKEQTFSALRNIKGFDADENLLDFMSDNSWRNANYLANLPLDLMTETCLNDSLVQQLMFLPSQLRPYEAAEDMPDWANFLNEHFPPKELGETFIPGSALPTINPEFAATFPEIPGLTFPDVKKFPNQNFDHVPQSAAKTEHFITSDNCMGCHGGLGGLPYGVDMFVKTGPKYGDGYNVSEYGEWRWSPMGLAGRDPIFYAQLESEMALLQENAKVPGLLKGSLKDNMEQVTNTCLSCHGAMGVRQLRLDAQADQTLDSIFKVEYVYLTEKLSANEPTPPDYRYHKYGELAREGISCTVCHHINAPDQQAVAKWMPSEKDWITKETPKELAYMLFFNNTGRFNRGPADELYGPYEDVTTIPMDNMLAMTPVYNAYTANSQMCGTCHTINLPNIGMQGDPFPVLTQAEQNPALAGYSHSIEQATFLEWQNSSFAAMGDEFKSCQDCHMPNAFQNLDGTINIDPLTTRIASIQGQGMPAADHETILGDINVPLRETYKRHEHVGLNVFLLEMFNQFPEVLGVNKADYMTSATNGNQLAIENMVRQARDETVDVKVTMRQSLGNSLVANVAITNKTGHRFPSGVAFRRAFVEVLVLDGDRIIWGSGRTNSVGVIVDENGQPLKTEFLPDTSTYQRHHQQINRQDQVQIYQELNQDQDHKFTTSFIHRDFAIKDNRLLPKGWRAADFFKPQGQVMFQFMEATDPEHVGNDPDYQDQGPGFPGMDNTLYIMELPDGTDLSNVKVQATVYYQAIPPFWLHQRFFLASDQPATQRLYYLTSHLDTRGTAIENWKLRLASDVVEVKKGKSKRN